MVNHKAAVMAQILQTTVVWLFLAISIKVFCVVCLPIKIEKSCNILSWACNVSQNAKNWVNISVCIQPDGWYAKTFPGGASPEAHEYHKK